MNESFREIGGIVALFAAVVLSVWTARRRLRPWHVTLCGVLAVISSAITAAMLAEGKTGAYAGWGGLGLIIVLLPAGFVAAISITALLTMAVLLPIYGFSRQTAAEREAERAFRRTPEYARQQALFKLKLSLSSLVLVLGYLALQRLMR